MLYMFVAVFGPKDLKFLQKKTHGHFSGRRGAFKTISKDFFIHKAIIYNI